MAYSHSTRLHPPLSVSFSCFVYVCVCVCCGRLHAGLCVCEFALTDLWVFVLCERFTNSTTILSLSDSTHACLHSCLFCLYLFALWNVQSKTMLFMWTFILLMSKLFLAFPFNKKWRYPLLVHLSFISLSCFIIIFCFSALLPVGLLLPLLCWFCYITDCNSL